MVSIGPGNWRKSEMCINVFIWCIDVFSHLPYRIWHSCLFTFPRSLSRTWQKKTWKKKLILGVDNIFFLYFLPVHEFGQVDQVDQDPQVTLSKINVPLKIFSITTCLLLILLEVNLSYKPYVNLIVGWFVSMCHNFLKRHGRNTSMLHHSFWKQKSWM